jgi:hypothetical protein
MSCDCSGGKTTSMMGSVIPASLNPSGGRIVPTSGKFCTRCFVFWALVIAAILLVISERKKGE